MAEHAFTREDVINRLELALNKTLEDIDTEGIFEKFKDVKLQKGIAGTIIEQCVFEYPPDTKQEPDLVIDGVKTELKTTGMLIDNNPTKHYVAKEKLSVTAVSIHKLSEQEFDTSHFWTKLEHLLFVYYLYLRKRNEKITPVEYKPFSVKGYQFYEFTEDEKAALKADWENVHSLVSDITSRLPGERNKEWKEKVKKEYIERHGEIRKKGLNVVDLAPTYPPRFQLKSSFVSTIIAKHFGEDLEQLPGKYKYLNDVNEKCHELAQQYKGMTLEEIATSLGVTINGDGDKNVAEQVLVKMFGGNSKKLNRIEIFQRFGITAKTVVVTPTGAMTEDTKMYHVDFDEFMETEIEDIDEDDNVIIRKKEYEDSELYTYFETGEFLCILFEEPAAEYYTDSTTGKRKKKKIPLKYNKFLGFKRIFFSDEILNSVVKNLWVDTRDKIGNKTLVDEPTMRKGQQLVLKNGELSSAPNFMKSSENGVYIKGGANDSSSKNKTECVNDIKMLPQYVWLNRGFMSERLAEADYI